MEGKLAKKPGCFICELPIANKKERRKLSNLYNKSVIWLHSGCMKTYNEMYFHGVLITELQNKKCDICDMPFDTKTFTVNKRKKIRHLMCIGNECIICRKPIAQYPHSIYIDYNPAGSQHLNSINSHTTGSRNFRGGGIGSKSKHKIHNKCVYIYRDTTISKAWIALDDFWPDICNKVTFSYFPKEFKLMAVTFMMIISKLRLKTTINTDTLFIILNYCIRPAYYKYHNGFDLGLQCRMCDRPTPITRLDVNLCSNVKCKYIEYRCQCGIDVPYHADPKISCTKYRCYSVKCICGGDIRYSEDVQPELCTAENCNIMYHVACTCGKKMYKVPTSKTPNNTNPPTNPPTNNTINNNNNRTTTITTQLLTNNSWTTSVTTVPIVDGVCSIMRCGSRIFERNCKCGAPLYKNDPLIRSTLCVVDNCKLYSRYKCDISQLQGTQVRSRSGYKK